MAFRLQSDESLAKGIRRLVRRQIDKALDRIKKDGGKDEAVHDARKRFKRIRAVLHLVRDELGEKTYRRENTCFRDAGGPLTEVRDAKVLLDTLDQLSDHFAGQIAAGAFDTVRRALKANRRAVRRRVLQEDKAVKGMRKAIAEARTRVPDWRIRQKGWPALRRGLKRIYRSGSRALATASADATVENLHEWRKQAKYLWHQLQILEPVWPRIMKELANQDHELTQHLGDDHDLAMLRETVIADPDAFGGDSTLETLVALIDRRRGELQQEAFLLGRRLYRDKPKVFTDRIKGYWKAWRSEAEAART
jgi:CHAD domain-containing protein